MNRDQIAPDASLACRVCCKEIPLDAAFTPEGAEYVTYFCGLDCYRRFIARARDVPGGEDGTVE